MRRWITTQLERFNLLLLVGANFVAMSIVAFSSAHMGDKTLVILILAVNCLVLLVTAWELMLSTGLESPQRGEVE